NVQEVRLAGGCRAPPRIWTFLISLRVFPRVCGLSRLRAPHDLDVARLDPAVRVALVRQRATRVALARRGTGGHGHRARGGVRRRLADDHGTRLDHDLVTGTKTREADSLAAHPHARVRPDIDDGAVAQHDLLRRRLDAGDRAH